MQFIRDNLPFFISTGLAILSGVFNFYQYGKNKEFKKYASEKELRIKIAELKNEKGKYEDSLTDYSNFGNDRLKLEREYEFKTEKIKSEIEYLEKILNKKK